MDHQGVWVAKYLLEQVMFVSNVLHLVFVFVFKVTFMCLYIYSCLFVLVGTLADLQSCVLIWQGKQDRVVKRFAWSFTVNLWLNWKKRNLSFQFLLSH